MTDSMLIFCLVLAGPIATSATESVMDGDFLELPESDFNQLSRWGIVRRATDAEEKAAKALNAPDPVAEEPKETPAAKKKREADEAIAAKELADKESAVKLAAI